MGWRPTLRAHPERARASGHSGLLRRPREPLFRHASVTLLQGSHGWHPGPDRGSRAALRLTRDARLALQAEPGPTPPHPRTEAQGRELAGVRREPAPARQLDGLVF